MTTQNADAQIEEADAVEPLYAFSPEIIESMGRSVQHVIGERLCDAASFKLKEPDAWQTMTYKELRKLFKDNCADQDGYLSPQAPLLETVVRMLLASKKDQLGLNEIYADVSALWITSPWPRHITVESLQRVLDNGLGYGIVRAN